MHSKDSIVDYNEFLALLQEKSKEELIEILGSIVEDEPELLLKFFSRINDPKKNLEAIKKSLLRMDTLKMQQNIWMKSRNRS